MTQDDSHKTSEAASQAIFARLGAHELSPGSYLKTRVLAHQKELEQGRRKARVWRRLAIGALSVAVIFAASTLWVGKRYDALVDQTVAIRLDSSSLGTELSQVAFIRIELPAGVQFHSKSYPEISEQASLTLAWKPGTPLDRIPVLVRATEDGLKTVRVSFLNGESRVVSSDQIKIRFKKI
jgi:hypothetical protein